MMFDLGLDRIWETMTDWIPPQLLTPEFIGWFWIVVAIVLGGAAIAYFIPMTRSLFGAVGMASIAFIVGMWKGIGYHAAKQKQQKEREREQTPKPTFKFPWQF